MDDLQFPRADTRTQRERLTSRFDICAVWIDPALGSEGVWLVPETLVMRDSPGRDVKLCLMCLSVAVSLSLYVRRTDPLWNKMPINHDAWGYARCALGSRGENAHPFLEDGHKIL